MRVARPVRECEGVWGGVDGGLGGASLLQRAGWPARPGWALLPWGPPMTNRDAWSWGFLMGLGKALSGRQEARVRGMAQRPLAV